MDSLENMTAAPDPTTNDRAFVNGFRDRGLYPDYVRVSLDDLAKDQIAIEDRLGSIEIQVKIAFGAGMLGVGLGMLLLKINKAVLNNLAQIGQGLYTTQQYVGMVGDTSSAQTKPDPKSKAKESDAVDVGASGYDPGPQSVPEDVAEQIVSEPLPADPHDDGTGVS